MRKQIAIALYILVLLVGFSCSKFRRIEKNPDWHVKYQAGLDYFAKKKYLKASTLFEQILPVVRGLPEGEKVQFNQAYCQFNMSFFLLASEQFKTFFETYGRSSVAEEARYMYALSLYKASPNFNLDQSSSIDAMAAMQEFLNRYPNSKFKDQAIEVIVSAQEKLENKGFANAKLYFRMRYYKAAMVSFNNFRNNYPDSKYVEEAYYLTILAGYKLALQSIYSKQNERYTAVVEVYKEFLDKYPQSNFLVEAEKLYADSLTKLTKTKKNNNS
jgi:outer membrane protein assembly factor BamD